MRTFIILFSLLAAGSPAFAHRDRIEHPRTVAISFATGESVTFAISNATIAAVTVRIGSSNHTIPQNECAKLREVRFETIKFLWNGSYSNAASADYFYVQFDMGPESARAFGELPRIQLMFRGGKFADTTVTRKTGDGSWQDSNL